MNILIDGYNVLMAGSRPLSKGIGVTDALRDWFIDELVSYKALKGHSICIVFDGWKNGRPLEQNENFRGITVIFSKKGERADDVIKRVVTPDGGNWVVVSSDLDVRHYCRAKGAVTIHSREFISKLKLASYTVMKGIVSEDDDLEELTYKKAKKRAFKRPPASNRKYLEAMKKL